MTILSLAALPAATHVARDAVAGGAQMGMGFLKLLSNLTETSSETNIAESSTAAPQSAKAAPESGSLTERTMAFSQRLAKWLRQQPSLASKGEDNRPIDIQLSLDQLDRPTATLSGEPSDELIEALNNEPGWLDEFRELALDRIEQMGPTSSNSPLQSLTIHQESATMDVQHRWN